MSDSVEFDHVLPELDKYETSLQNYLIHKSIYKFPEWEPNHLLAYNEPPFKTKQPNISLWDFMEEQNLKEYLLLQKKSDIRKYISMFQIKLC